MTESTDTGILSNREYTEKKKKEFMDATNKGEVKEGLTWDMVLRQVISGIYLALTQKQIDMYTTFCYDYAQMEMIKIALYAKLQAKKIKKICDPELNAHSMLEVILSSEEAKSIDGVKASIKVFMDELEYMKEEINREKKNIFDELMKDIQKKNEEIEQLKENIQYIKHQRSPTPPKIQKNKMFKMFKLFKKKETDLMSEMLSSDMEAAQMEVIRYAIDKNVDEDIIRDLIKRKCSAEQMRAVLAIVLTKSSKERQITDFCEISGDYENCELND